MRKLFVSFLLISIFFNSEYIVKASTYVNTDNDKKSYEATMKQDIFSLMMAYPEYIIDVKKNGNDIFLVLKSGKKIIYDDKMEKSFDQKLSNPDLQDMLEQTYPLSPAKKIMETNFDPGRCRVYPLLYEVYGTTRQSIESNLKNVDFHYRSFQFNGNNKASQCLQAAINELAPMANKNMNIGSCLFPCSGTYNYRLISGTNQLSPHSFGIALDLAVNKVDYWKWSSKADGERRLSSYPQEIVEIFEKNNFIWGGKWNHFDIMHFEYRPEIIAKAKYFGGKYDSSKPWTNGLNLDDTLSKNIINKINAALK